MKIMYLVHQFYPYYFSGTEKFVYHMAMCMQKQGHNVTVVTYAFKDNLKHSVREGNLLTERYMYHGIPVISFGYEKAAEDVHYGVDQADLEGFAERLLTEEKPEIIHAGHPMRVFGILKAARKQSIPYIITLTDFWAICFRGNLLDSGLDLCAGPEGGERCVKYCPHLPHGIIDSRLKATREVLAAARRVCSPTRFLAGIYMNEIHGLDIKVIPLGLKTAKVLEDKTRLKKGDPVTVMFGGTWLPHKGLHLLLEAFHGVESVNLVLKIYGTGPDKEYNDLVRSSAERDKRIQIQGVFREEDIDTMFRDADCSVLPSIWWENSPYMMTEALARNVPLIVSDVDGLTEYVTDGFNGFTFKMGDVLHLREIIERIVDDPGILNTMRENLSRFVLQTVEEEACAYEGLYLGRE